MNTSSARSAVLSFSGGLDSTTVLVWLLRNNFTKIHCVHFQYGSKHNEFEKRAAEKVLAYYTDLVKRVPPAQGFCDFTYRTLDASAIFGNIQSNLLKTGEAIPEGNYTDASMKLTVVPARNIIFLSILAGIAWSEKARYIAIGVHAGDHTIYPDCRPEFINKMNLAILSGTDQNVRILSPFINVDKGKVVRYGNLSQVPFELTRTCYKDQEIACGKCGSCMERKKAFSDNELIDPITYEEDIK